METVYKELFTFIISSIFFWNFNIPVPLYLLILCLGWGMVLYFYSKKENANFHRDVLAGVFGNFIAYVVTILIKLLTNYAVFTPIDGESDKFVVMASPWVLAWVLFICPILINEFNFSWLYSHCKVTVPDKCADTQAVQSHEKQGNGKSAKQQNVEPDKQLNEQSGRQSYKQSNEQSDKGENKGENILFPEHQKDIERIKAYLRNTHILGINSPWGNGKTFVMDYFCNDEETKKEYSFIKINALAYNYDEFDTILISRLDELLRENHIFSLYAAELLSTMNKSLWGRFLYHYFRGADSGNTAAFTGLKGDLKSLNKKVLIIFEDLERVSEPNAVKKILSISELMAGDKVYVVYEYDREQFEKQPGLSSEYLKKYIPLEMELTDLSYRQLVENLWNGQNMDSVNCPILGGVLSGQDVKSFIESFQRSLKSTFQIKEVKVNLIPDLLPQYITTRLVKDYLIEVRAHLEEVRLGKEEPYMGVEFLQLRVIVAVLFLKNFVYSFFEKIKPGVPLDECFPLEIDGQQMDIGQLYDYWTKNNMQGEQETAVNQGTEAINDKPGKNQMTTGQCKNTKLGKSAINSIGNDQRRKEDFANHFEQQLQKPGNLTILMVYSMFSYDCNSYEIASEYKLSGKKISTSRLKSINLSIENRNRCNHLMWNLVQNGRSEYSDVQATVTKFIKDVLTTAEDKREDSWRSFQHDLYHGKIYKDNRTIFIIGNNVLRDLTYAMFICHQDSSTWESYVKFLEWAWKKEPVDKDFFQICNYIELDSPGPLFSVISWFKELKAEGNFNSFEGYGHFLQKYVTGLFTYGYISGKFYTNIEALESIFKDTNGPQKIVNFLQEIVASLSENKKILSNSKKFNNEERTVKAFLEKNIEIIKKKNETKGKESKVKFEYLGSVFPHQKKIDYFKKFMEAPYSKSSEDNLKSDIAKAYDNNELYPIEVQELEYEIDEWKKRSSSEGNKN